MELISDDLKNTLINVVGWKEKEVKNCYIRDLKNCIFNNYIVIPLNNAESDDYHFAKIVHKFNMRQVFAVEIDIFIASCIIYEKIDANMPAYMLIACEYKPHNSIVIW